MQAVQAYSNCAVLWDGTMFTPEVHLSAEDLVEMGVKDSYNFGPPLIGKTAKKLHTIWQILQTTGH